MKIKLSALYLVCLGITTLQAQTVTDIDGNVYKTVTIGTQTWMAENLKTTKFNDGTPIPLVTNYDEWHALATPAYSWYENDVTFKNSHGAFYNGFTVDKGNLCPIGWHVPSDDEWTTLTTFLGGESVAGGKLKETGLTYWNSPNNGATDETGFAARGGGYINEYGFNYYVKDNGSFWSSTGPYENFLWFRTLDISSASIVKSSSYMQVGNSVRCIRDGTGEPVNPIALTKAEQKQPELVTFKNEAFRFEVTPPAGWSFSKMLQQDPYEEFKTGRYSTSISTGESDEVPENWNGFKLSSTGPLYDACPSLVIYAHKVGDQQPEDFAKLLESTLTNFGVTDLTLNREFSVNDAIGFDCVYDLGIKVRYSVLYRNGIRVVMQYFFPSNDPIQFEQYAPEVDKVIKSLRIK